MYDYYQNKQILRIAFNQLRIGLTRRTNGQSLAV